MTLKKQIKEKLTKIEEQNLSLLSKCFLYLQEFIALNTQYREIVIYPKKGIDGIFLYKLTDSPEILLEGDYIKYEDIRYNKFLNLTIESIMLIFEIFIKVVNESSNVKIRRDKIILSEEFQRNLESEKLSDCLRNNNVEFIL